jgi:hypothetical protein
LYFQVEQFEYVWDITEIFRGLSVTNQLSYELLVVHSSLRIRLISFTSTFAYSEGYRYTSISFGNVVDQFHDEYCFTHPGVFEVPPNPL